MLEIVNNIIKIGSSNTLERIKPTELKNTTDGTRHFRESTYMNMVKATHMRQAKIKSTI